MLYFDVTDIVHFATRYNRLTGIQRVQYNIIGLLARKHGTAVIRCTFFDCQRREMFEFSPEVGDYDGEFDAERLLKRLGLASSGSRFPSKVQVKSYLRPFNNNKILRTLKKCEVYLAALVAPARLQELGFASVDKPTGSEKTEQITRIERLPPGSTYVCMGAMWLHPEARSFAVRHRLAGERVVQMIHDLIPLQRPQFYSSGESQAVDKWLKGSFNYVSHFISVSQSTAGALRDYAGAQGASLAIRVIPLAHEFMGYERGAVVTTPPKLENLAGHDFVLCVGTIEHRKNGTALLQVWQELIGDFEDRVPLLVFAGRFGQGSGEFERFLERHEKLARSVRVVHAPSDQELAWLYRNALFTTFPSLIEGWGLPVGESAWFGKFCVASRETSIPEVCGELVDYVDPYDLSSIKSGLTPPIVDRDFLREREAAIRDAKLRTWENVADEIHAYATEHAH